MSFAGKPQALLDYLAAHPGAFELVSMLAEQDWTDAQIENLMCTLRRGPTFWDETILARLNQARMALEEKDRILAALRLGRPDLAAEEKKER